MSQLTSVRKVANGGLQAELHDKVQKPGRLNVLAALNLGDERFNQGSMRRAWFPVTIQSLELLGASEGQIEKIKSMSEGDRVELFIDNPMIEGEVLRIQVTETTTPDAWQRENVMKAAKQISIDGKIAGNKGLKSNFNLTNYMGQNAYFIDADGNFIFSRGTVTVNSQLSHTFVEHADLVPETELGNAGVTLADPVRIETLETADAGDVKF